MPRRKKTSPLEDMIDVVSMPPWWVGIALAPVSYFLAHTWAVRIAAEMVGRPQITSGIYYAVASAGQLLVPFVCLAGAAVSVWRRSRRKELADNVAPRRRRTYLKG
jgi:restriction system protein